MTLLLSVVTGVTDFLYGFSVTILPSIVTDVTFFLSKLCTQEDKEGMERMYGKPCSWYHGIGSLYKATNEHMLYTHLPV